jgi:hypothetical protein
VSRIISFSMRFFWINPTLIISPPGPVRSGVTSVIAKTDKSRPFFLSDPAAVIVDSRPRLTITFVPDGPAAAESGKAQALGFGSCNLHPRFITSVQHCDLSQILRSVWREPARAFAKSRLFPKRACRLGRKAAPVLRSLQLDSNRHRPNSAHAPTSELPGDARPRKGLVDFERFRRSYARLFCRLAFFRPRFPLLAGTPTPFVRFGGFPC